MTVDIVIAGIVAAIVLAVENRPKPRLRPPGLARSVAETMLVGGVCAGVAYAVGLAFRL